MCKLYATCTTRFRADQGPPRCRMCQEVSEVYKLADKLLAGSSERESVSGEKELNSGQKIRFLGGCQRFMEEFNKLPKDVRDEY